MSIEEIQKLKEKIGLKLYNQALGLEKNKKREKFVRENKNRPREISSKKKVGRFREVVPVSFEHKLEKRDPRFEASSGDFDEKVKRLGITKTRPQRNSYFAHKIIVRVPVVT